MPVIDVDSRLLRLFDEVAAIKISSRFTKGYLRDEQCLKRRKQMNRALDINANGIERRLKQINAIVERN